MDNSKNSHRKAMQGNGPGSRDGSSGPLNRGSSANHYNAAKHSFNQSQDTPVLTNNHYHIPTNTTSSHHFGGISSHSGATAPI